MCVCGTKWVSEYVCVCVYLCARVCEVCVRVCQPILYGVGKKAGDAGSKFTRLKYLLKQMRNEIGYTLCFIRLKSLLRSFSELQAATIHRKHSISHSQSCTRIRMHSFIPPPQNPYQRHLVKIRNRKPSNLLQVLLLLFHTHESFKRKYRNDHWIQFSHKHS